MRSTLSALSRRLTDDGHIHIIDLELPESPPIPRRLAQWDRGKFPRSRDQWRGSSPRSSSRLSSSRFPFRHTARSCGRWSTSREGDASVSEPRVSIAIALYNEEEVLPELLRRLTAVLDVIPGGPHEMVLVDDGSSDRTLEMLTAAAAEDPRIIGISLSRNFGHQAALSAALDNVSGDVVVVMDGDLQDRPEEIPRFIEAYKEGFDVVYATRVDRQERWLLRVCYFLFYRLIALVSDLPMPLDSGDFALLSRRVVDRINALPERNRYLRGLRTWIGFKQAGVPVKRDARAAGKPAYTLRKLVQLALDGLFAFSVAPLRAAAVLGGFAAAGASVFAAYSIFERVFLGQSPQGFTALIVVIIFFSGVQLSVPRPHRRVCRPGIRRSEGTTPLHRLDGRGPTRNSGLALISKSRSGESPAVSRGSVEHTACARASTRYTPEPDRGGSPAGFSVRAELDHPCSPPRGSGEAFCCSIALTRGGCITTTARSRNPHNVFSTANSAPGLCGAFTPRLGVSPTPGSSWLLGEDLFWLRLPSSCCSSPTFLVSMRSRAAS